MELQKNSSYIEKQAFHGQMPSLLVMSNRCICGIITAAVTPKAGPFHWQLASKPCLPGRVSLLNLTCKLFSHQALIVMPQLTGARSPKVSLALLPALGEAFHIQACPAERM